MIYLKVHLFFEKIRTHRFTNVELQVASTIEAFIYILHEFVSVRLYDLDCDFRNNSCDLTTKSDGTVKFGRTLTPRLNRFVDMFLSGAHLTITNP